MSFFNNQKYEANGYINEGYRLKNRSTELDNSKNEKYLDVYDMILKYGLENSLLDNNMLRAELRADLRLLLILTRQILKSKTNKNLKLRGSCLFFTFVTKTDIYVKI